MFENLFKKDPPSAAVTAAETEKTPAGSPGNGSTSALSAVSDEETHNWQDRILAAATDDAALLQLAHEAPTVALKLAAIEALTHENTFRQAMHDFREHDKRLYRAAKSRWETASGKRVATDEASALIAGARALLDHEVVAVNHVVELDRAWAALNSELLVPALAAEFAALSEQLGARVRTHGERTQAITRWLGSTDHAMAQLHESLPGVARGETPPTDADPHAVALLELVHSIADAGDLRCTAKADAAKRLLALASSVAQRAAFLQTLPVTAQADEGNEGNEDKEAREKHLIEQWRSFPEISEGDANEWHTVLAARFADWRNASTHARQRDADAHSAQERERRAQQNKLRVNAIQRDIEAAEAAQAEGHVADLTRLLAAIDHALKRGAVNAVLTQRIEVLHAEQRRLQDWQRWGGRQGREQLVTEAQTLSALAAGKVAVKTHAEAIDKLRERWKELDKLGGASNQTLWLNFDGALKAAYAPVAAHLDKLKLERDENLAKREQIVDALVQASAKFFPVTQEGVTPAPDWRALAHTLEEAQLTWRKLGPVEHTVPRKALKGDTAITTRYAAATQALAAPLKSAYGEARSQREALIAVARDLAASDVAARDVIDKVRKAQTQWQAVAKALPLPRRDENALWAAFKTATDALFTARDAARTASEAEFSAKLKAREAVIERVAALASAPSAPDIKRALTEAETAWRAAPEAPRPQAARLDARYRAAREAATRRLGELALHASQARFDALIAKMALCHEREVAQDADRAITDEKAADLENRWQAVEHFPEAWKAKLEARFRGNSVSASSVSNVPSNSKAAKAAVESLPDILLNLEVACGVDSPGDFLAARQHLKIRALKNAMEGRHTAVTTPADIERWMLDAAAYPRADDVSRERLAKIIAVVRRRQA